MLKLERRCFLIYWCMLITLRLHVLKLMGLIKGFYNTRAIISMATATLNERAISMVRDLGKKAAKVHKGSHVTTWFNKGTQKQLDFGDVSIRDSLEGKNLTLQSQYSLLQKAKQSGHPQWIIAPTLWLPLTGPAVTAHGNDQKTLFKSYVLHKNANIRHLETIAMSLDNFPTGHLGILISKHWSV